MQELRRAGEVSPTFVDVFCEKGFFDAQQTRAILEVTCHAPVVHCCKQLHRRRAFPALRCR